MKSKNLVIYGAVATLVIEGGAVVEDQPAWPTPDHTHQEDRNPQPQRAQFDYFTSGSSMTAAPNASFPVVARTYVSHGGVLKVRIPKALGE